MDRLEAAADERGVFQSELIRRAVRLYIKENPDGIRAFTGGSAQNRNSGQKAVDEAEADIDRPASTTYDPTEDL